MLYHTRSYMLYHTRSYNYVGSHKGRLAWRGDRYHFALCVIQDCLQETVSQETSLSSLCLQQGQPVWERVGWQGLVGPVTQGSVHNMHSPLGAKDWWNMNKVILVAELKSWVASWWYWRLQPSPLWCYGAVCFLWAVCGCSNYLLTAHGLP